MLPFFENNYCIQEIFIKNFLFPETVAGAGAPAAMDELKSSHGKTGALLSSSKGAGGEVMELMS